MFEMFFNGWITGVFVQVLRGSPGGEGRTGETVPALVGQQRRRAAAAVLQGESS